jgi:cyclohexyl-isocyanide hydratase
VRLAPDAAITDAPQLDVLHVPVGFGKEQLIDDARLMSWPRQQAAGAGLHGSTAPATKASAVMCGTGSALARCHARAVWTATVPTG